MARVLLWSSAFWPLIGGVEVLADKTIAELRGRGHEFMVVTDRAGNLDRFSTHDGVPIHRMDMVETIASHGMERWIEVRRLIANLKREFKPDIVWMYLAQIDGVFHMKSEAACPAPTLLTLHGATPDAFTAAGTVVGDLVRGAAWVSACSEFVLGESRRQNPEIVGRSSAILNGLDMPAVDPRSPDEARLNLVCVGRIGSLDEKGFDVAVDAMRIIRHGFPNARLTIAGDGAGRKILEQHARVAGVEESVDFVGWVHPDRVYDLMHEATLVLVPSRVSEGFGLVALQAQQMSRAVVASRIGGIPEVIQDGVTGLLVEPGDASSLANAIMQLLSDPARAARMGAAGRKRARDHFGFERYVNDYDALLTRLTANRSPEPVAA